MEEVEVGVVGSTLEVGWAEISKTPKQLGFEKVVIFWGRVGGWENL